MFSLVTQKAALFGYSSRFFSSQLAKFIPPFLPLESDEDASFGCLWELCHHNSTREVLSLCPGEAGLGEAMSLVTSSQIKILECFSLIFVPLPAVRDSLENVFGDCVFWDTWVDYGKMEQHINLAESWKSRDIRSPRLHLS